MLRPSQLGLSVVLALAACGTDASPPEGGPATTTSTDDAGGAPVTPPSDAGTRTPPVTPPCGADGGALCLPGAPCTSDAECEATCQAGTCAAPTTSDGRVSASLGETDVDCGGLLAPACGTGRGCAVDSDCTTSICSALTKKCTTAPSCRGGANGPGGIETCGTGEPGSPDAIDSCCRSLPLPQTATRSLDRYEITAGRVRAFVDALTTKGNGRADVRGFAKAYAAAHPSSQLADVEVSYPGVLDILPDQGDPNAPGALAVHLGVFPLDPINTLDGCFVGDDSYGHPTYWQPPTVLGAYGIGKSNGATFDGKRVYSRDVLDQKPMNCVMPLMLAAFCAWDGGELARTSDYREVYGNHPYVVGTTTVWVPWASLLSIGEFNWRNGHGNESGLDAWPGFLNPQPVFYAFPTPHNPANDDTPAIGAPGRFAKDVSATRSADGSGWFDLGGNLLEAAWLSGPLRPASTVDICDVSESPGPGQTACARRGIPGVLRRAGALPGMLLVGHSFEGHQQYGAKFLATGTDDDDAGASLRTITFQYGKLGGRCARPSL